jgi:uncharacterized protein
MMKYFNISSTQTEPRVKSLDALRGFALLGILYAHMTIWFTGSALPDDFYLQFQDTPSQVAMAIFGVLVLGKFYTIFSFLFGFSFYQQAGRSSTYAAYLNRMLVLGSFGLIHHLIWNGDILLIYALLAFSLIAFNKLSNTSLLIVSLILILNVPGQLMNAILPLQEASVNLPMAEKAEAYVRIIATADFQAMVQHNASTLAAKFFYQLRSGRVFITLGFFLLGLFTARKKYFENFLSNIQLFISISKMAVIGGLTLLSAAGCLVLAEVVSFPSFDYPPQYRWVLQLMYDAFNFSVSALYICVFLLVYHNKESSVLSAFQFPGRMPLTIYFTQTIIGLFLFYHMGLGLFTKTTPAHNAVMVVPIFVFQVWVSKFWLNKFHHGPLEWLWRCLAESRWVRLRRRALS